jgi:hypothetical protein
MLTRRAGEHLVQLVDQHVGIFKRLLPVRLLPETGKKQRKPDGEGRL